MTEQNTENHIADLLHHLTTIPQLHEQLREDFDVAVELAGIAVPRDAAKAFFRGAAQAPITCEVFGQSPCDSYCFCTNTAPPTYTSCLTIFFE
jgi:hypothetical protein